MKNSELEAGPKSKMGGRQDYEESIFNIQKRNQVKKEVLRKNGSNGRRLLGDLAYNA